MIKKRKWKVERDEEGYYNVSRKDATIYCRYIEEDDSFYSLYGDNCMYVAIISKDSARLVGKWIRSRKCENRWEEPTIRIFRDTVSVEKDRLKILFGYNEKEGVLSKFEGRWNMLPLPYHDIYIGDVGAIRV